MDWDGQGGGLGCPERQGGTRDLLGSRLSLEGYKDGLGWPLSQKEAGGCRDGLGCSPAVGGYGNALGRS